MKIPITKIKDVDNKIYEYVFYTEEQLKEFKEQHKINFYDVLEAAVALRHSVIVWRHVVVRGRSVYRPFFCVD
tara:strand:- start:1027 stop:1245 length:219 start_codon:yes stop_codon:yes gene_type:complete